MAVCSGLAGPGCGVAGGLEGTAKSTYLRPWTRAAAFGNTPLAVRSVAKALLTYRALACTDTARNVHSSCGKGFSEPWQESERLQGKDV